jgi:hypothetical protein
MAGDTSRLDMATEVLDNLARSSSGLTRNQVQLSTRVVTWLNRAQVWAARESARQGTFLLTYIATANTVAAQKDYALPSDVLALFDIRLENGLQTVQLKPIMPWTFDRLMPKPDTQTNRQPYYYTPYRSTNTFELFPIPDIVYVMRIRYAQYATPLTTDAQLSDFSHVDDALIFKATEYGYRWLQEVQDANTWKERAKEALQQTLDAESAKYPDWEPVAQGFTSTPLYFTGDYYNDPFQYSDPGGWR